MNALHDSRHKKRGRSLGSGLRPGARIRIRAKVRVKVGARVTTWFRVRASTRVRVRSPNPPSVKWVLESNVRIGPLFSTSECFFFHTRKCLCGRERGQGQVRG